MAGRLARFLQLERGRQARGEKADPTSPERSARFGALETNAAAPVEVRSSRGHLARFDPPSAEELLVQEQREEDAPFVRCARCDVDSGRFARSCAACGADFDTPEQRAFNERVWAERRAQREAEQEQHRVMEQARLQDIAEAAEQNRARYRELARQVERETRQRIDGDPSYRLWIPWGRRRHLLPAGVNLGVLVGVSSVIAVAALAAGGTKLFVRALGFVAVVIAVSVVRWLLGR